MSQHGKPRYSGPTDPEALDHIRDEISACGFTQALAPEFKPRPIAGLGYLNSELSLRAEVRYWVRNYTDTSGT